MFDKHYAVTGRSLLMHELTNGHHLHSYVLLFLCLNYLLHPACGDMRSLVLARDDNVGGHCIWWVYTFFRQKNKSYDIECANVCSSELDVHYYTQC